MSSFIEIENVRVSNVNHNYEVYTFNKRLNDTSLILSISPQVSSKQTF